MDLNIELFKSSGKVPTAERLATVREIGLLGNGKKSHTQKKQNPHAKSQTLPPRVGEEKSASCLCWQRSLAKA